MQTEVGKGMTMGKSIMFSVSIFIFLLMASPAFSVSLMIENGTNYLNSGQNQSSSWGDTITASDTEYFSTIAVLDSYKQLGMDNTFQYQTGSQWIQSQTTENSAYISNRIYILANSGVDLTTDIDTLLSYRNSDGGWGIGLNYKSNNFHTALALQSLKAVNYSDQSIISSGIAYLTSNQNSDGGWGFCSSTSLGCSDGGSNVYITALVSSTLQQFTQATTIATAINKATSYLIAHQTTDGGFGNSPSTVYETSLAYIALVGMITDNTVLGNAINYLTSAQLSDGSWNDDPYSTALALRALYFSENRPTPPPPPSPPTTGTITGRLTDASTNQPLNGVSVSAISIQPPTTTTTDATGSFVLSDIPQGSQTITFILAGYGAATMTVPVTAGSIISVGTVSLYANPTTGIIRGIVTDSSNGQPLSGVAITSSGSFSGSATTGADGSFIFSNVTPGAVTLSAAKAGYGPVNGTGTVTAGGILFFNPQMTTLPPQPSTGTVTGKVIDASDNQPVSGVYVELLSNGSTVNTDVSGNFTLSNVPSGSQTIIFMLAGYTDITVTADIVGGANNNLGTISLSPNPTTGVIRGTVTDASNNQPLSGVTIKLTGAFTASAVTGADGKFIFTGVTPGAVTVTASKIGYSTLTGTVNIVACSIFNVNPVMTPTQTGTIRGTATDSASGRPLSGVTITVTGSFNRSAITGTDGTFIFINATAGTVNVTATRSGYNIVSGTGTVTAGGVLFFNPQMTASPLPPASGTVTGKVIDAFDGQPVAWAFVEVLSSGATVRTDSTGSFTLTNVPTGSQIIFFYLAGYTDVAMTIDVVEGAMNDLGTISFSPFPTTGVIRGTVTDSTNNQPLSGVTVTILGPSTGSFVTGSDGKYIFTNVNPGSVTVTASKPGYYTLTGQVVVVACSINYFDPKFTLAGTTGNLTARVYDAATNMPIQGARIYLSGGPSGSTDSQGVFLISNITPHAYQATISASGYTSRNYQVTVTAQVTTDMQTIKLDPSPQSTTVTGKVTDASTGVPVAGADVTVVETAFSTKTDFTGAYAITGITLLDFNMKASAPGYDSRTMNLKAADYGTLTTDFSLSQSQTSALRITSLTTAKGDYAEDEDVLITATIENDGSAEISGLVSAEIQDGEGNVIAVASPSEPHIILASSGSIQMTMKWNTGQFAPGDYLIRLKVTDPSITAYPGSQGILLAEMATSVSITPAPALGGAIALSPPVTQANMQEPIAITAAIRNTGNIPVSTSLRLEATFNGNVVYTTDVSITDLPVNNIQEFNLGSFIPQGGGNYTITLRPTDSTITSNITANLYVGDYATATFIVTPDKAVIGDAKVTGKINLKGIASAMGSVNDPLVPLMKDAIQKGVYWEQTNAVDWQNSDICYGCHVQTQTLIGMEVSRDKVAVDDERASELLDYLKGCQTPSGMETRYVGYMTEANPIEATVLYAWSLAYYHDTTQIQSNITNACDYLITKQNSFGYWVSDYYYGSNDWWSDLGGSQPSTPFTAYSIIALAKSYELSGQQKYKDAMLKAVNYLKGANHARSVITASHIVMGLESVYSHIDDPSLNAALDVKINAAIAYLRSNQNTDGGWGRYAGNPSDPLPTAHVLYAMSLAGVSGTDQILRNGATYLLNKQNPDGTWTTAFIRKDTYPDKHFAPTTWAIISLPFTLEVIAGVKADLTVSLPQDVTLNYSSISPTQTGAATHWDFKGLTDNGKDLLLDLTFNGLQLAEERKAASDAYLSFNDTYTGKTIKLPIVIPTVTGISPVAVHVETDKELYDANEPVNITTAVTNVSPEMRNPTAEITLEDKDGNVVNEVASLQVGSLNPVHATTFLYGWSKRVKLTLDHGNVNTDLTDFPVRLHLSGSSGINKADLSSVFNELTIDPNDDFSGETGNPPNTDRWDVFYYATISDNQLRIPSFGGYKNVRSKFQLKGDFDIQVDYGFDVYPGSQDGWQTLFKIMDGNDVRKQLQIDRRYDGLHGITFNKRVSDSWTSIARFNTTEQSGKFRMTRAGAVFSAYFWNGSAWSLLDSYTYSSWSAATLVELASNSFTSNPQNTILLDNFIVNAGQVAYDGNRKKIAVTTSDGLIQCYVEMEKWDAFNKEAELWVKIPAVSSTEDTVLYLYYDSAQPDNTQYVGDTGSMPGKNVWNGNYKGVYHMAQDPSFSEVKDSTLNTADGRAGGSMTPSDLVDAKVGKGLDFDGTDDRVGVPDSSVFQAMQNITVEAWILPRRILQPGPFPQARQSIVSFKEGDNPTVGAVLALPEDAPSKARFWVMVNGTWQSATGTTTIAPNSSWYHLTGSYDGTALRIYVNGVLEGETPAIGTMTNAPGSTTSTITIGARASNNTNWFKGLIEEVSIVDIAFSPAWIKATYNNQIDNLITFGSPESADDVDPSATRTYNVTWNTGSTPAGDYLVRAKLYENGVFLSEDTASFTILPEKTLTSTVTTDRISYDPNQSVTVSSAIASTSANYIFENLTARITIANSQGTNLFTDTKSIPILIPGQTTDLKTYWNTGTYPPGSYPVTLEVTDAAGAVLSTSTQNLTISDNASPAKLLKGQISVDKQVILKGEPLAISYNVTNAGNIDLAQIGLTILTVSAGDATTYDTLTDQTALTMGNSYGNVKQLDTGTYSARDYLVILRAAISGVEETLSGTYFRVEGAPSAPSLDSPKQGIDVETLTPSLIINNASDPNSDTLTYEFEIYSDSGLANLVFSAGTISEGTGTTTWQVPSDLQENNIYYWRARAYDGILYGDWMLPTSFRVNVANDPPTAPTLSAPADKSEVTTFTPVLAVNNATDPDSANLTYNFDLALDKDFTQIVASAMGIAEGTGTTSWQLPVTLTENTCYYWRAQADDWLVKGSWMATAQFFVNTANESPTAPIVIMPSNGSQITTLSADVVAANSTDPDYDQLTYLFEMDTAITFDSPDIIRSGNIPEGQGTTPWNVNGLKDNTYYYVHVKANDGSADSPWSEVTGFFVNTVNDPPTVPVLANPSDGGAVTVFTPALAVHNSTDIDRDTLTYEFEIYEDVAMTKLVNRAVAIEETPQITAWTVPASLTENKTYYWRARAFDGELYSDWMTSTSFTVNTANDAPSAPILHSPADGASLDTLYPTLSVYNASDPDSVNLTYDFEVYSNNILVKALTGVPQNSSGITSVTLSDALADNTVYTWKARAYDGNGYGGWMDTASFSIHLPVQNITATINFDPDTLNKKSNGQWVTVYIELPAGYNVADIKISSLLLGGSIHAETSPSSIGDSDKDGIQDLMVKFNRNAVINLLPNGDNVRVVVTGAVGSTTFEGFDTIRVIK